MEELFCKKIIELLGKQGWKLDPTIEFDSDNDAESFLVYPGTCIGIHIMAYNSNEKVLTYELGVVAILRKDSKVKNLDIYFHRTANNIETPLSGAEAVIAAAKTMFSELKDKLEVGANLVNEATDLMVNTLTNNPEMVLGSLCFEKTTKIESTKISKESLKLILQGLAHPDLSCDIKFEGKFSNVNAKWCEYAGTIEWGISTAQNIAHLECWLEGSSRYNPRSPQHIYTHASKPLKGDLLDSGYWVAWAEDEISKVTPELYENPDDDDYENPDDYDYENPDYDDY